MSVLLLSGVLAAQVPTDTIVALSWYPDIVGPNGANRVKFVDPRGGGTADAYIPFPWTPPMAGIAADPIDDQRFYSIDVPGSVMQGVLAWNVGPMATPSGAWSIVNGGSRVRAGLQHVYFVANGAVQRVAKVGGAASPFPTIPNVVDISIVGSLLYVASRNPNPIVPSPLVEIDLVTGAQRTVGSYGFVDRIAASPATPRVALARNTATTSWIDEIDSTTGAVVSTIAAAGPVPAVTYSSSGHLIYGQSVGTGFQIYSAMAVPPLVHAVAPGLLVDLDYSRVATPSVMSFRVIGSTSYPLPWCGVGASAQWGASGLPRLGNASFALTLAGAPPSTLAAAFLGTSRTFSSVHQTALPIDLTSIGLTGCLLLVDPQVPVVLPVDANGTAVLPLGIPNSASLAGVEWVGQAFVHDASFAPLPFAATWGITMKLNP